MRTLKEFKWEGGGLGYFYLTGDGVKPFKDNPYIMFDMSRADLWSLLKATIKALWGG